MNVRNYSNVGKKCLSGKVSSVAQWSIKVKLTSGLVIHRHFDQIRRTVDEPTVEPASECDSEAYTYISVNSEESVASETVASPEAPAAKQTPHTRRIP